MKDEQRSRIIPIISGVLLVVVTIMANAYWVEAVRWADKADAADLQGNATMSSHCVENMNRAKTVFRVTASLLLLTLIATVLPQIRPQAARVAFIINIVSAFCIAVFCLIYISGGFYIPLR